SYACCLYLSRILCLSACCFYGCVHLRDLHSCPTRRSSDLVGGIEVVDVVHARGAELRRERDAPGTAQLVAVHAQAETGGGAGAQHPLRLFGVEGALFAEDVDPAYVREIGRAHV